ncbi:hypothetical protein [Chryseobacterium koreense]|nr:hypothetical protein [Chryseobacterium koreense]
METLILNIEQQYVSAKFFAEGHPKHHFAGFFPDEKIMFTICLFQHQR